MSQSSPGLEASRLEIKTPSSRRVRGRARAAAARRERENRAPKRFLVRSRGSPAAAARSAAHMKLLNASAVGENQTAANTWRSQEVPPLGDGRFVFPPCSLLTLQLLIYSLLISFSSFLQRAKRSSEQLLLLVLGLPPFIKTRHRMSAVGLIGAVDSFQTKKNEAGSCFWIPKNIAGSSPWIPRRCSLSSLQRRPKCTRSCTCKKT